MAKWVNCSSSFSINFSPPVYLAVTLFIESYSETKGTSALDTVAYVLPWLNLASLLIDDDGSDFTVLGVESAN